MQRLTSFVQGHQRMFLEFKQPDVQQAFLRAMREANRQAGGAVAAGTSSNFSQGVQREIHSGRKYPTFGNESFGPAYETWSDDMACILQGSCSPGSTRYCRTLSMFGKMELRDVMQSSSGLPTGARGYHTMPIWSPNAQSKWGSPHAQVWAAKNYATDTPVEGEGSPTKTEGQVSQRQRLKMAVRDYGSTVVVFHVCISLISLGGFYLAVSSGIDVKALLGFIGFSQEVIESKIATGTSTFLMSYAVHKCFAPVRIAITLTCTPFIVRYLRGIGLLKIRAK